MPLDVWGFIYSGIALLLIFHALSVLGGRHWSSWSIVIELIGAVLFGYLFIRQEDSSPAPLVHLDLFRTKLFVQANFIQTFFQIGQFGSIFIIAIYLQMNVGYTAMLAGIIMGMQAFGAICSSRLSVKLFELYTAKLPISIGLAGVGIITPFILCLNAESPVCLGFCILFARGLMSGLCGAPIQAIGIAEFSDEQISQAAAAFNIVRQLAISLGIALSGLLLSITVHNYDLNIMINQDKSVFYAPFALISCSVFFGVWVTLRMNKTSLMMNSKGKK